VKMERSSKVSLSIAIDLGGNPIAFEPRKGMLTHHSLSSEGLILGFLLIAKVASLGLFMRNLHVDIWCFLPQLSTAEQMASWSD
jgi:hypothetical protein